MSVQSSDLILYGSANMPEVDGVTAGGAIDTTTKVTFTDIAATDTVDVVSSLSEDSGNEITVVGRTSTGTLASGVATLNGTSDVLVNINFERIMKVLSDGTHHGTITVKRTTGDTTIGTLESGINTLRRPFYSVASTPSGTVEFVEKVFFKNNNTTNALLAAEISEFSDPSSFITFGVEDGQNDNSTVSNRKNTNPAGITFASTAVSVPGTDLLPGSGIGVWLKLNLASGASPTKSTYTLQIDGNTT